MKTKLETKFKKQSAPIIKELNAVEKKYEKFLINFIKYEIIGPINFNKHLNDELDFSMNSYLDWNKRDLLSAFIKKKDALEQAIYFQIFQLEDKECDSYEDGGPFKLALAKKGR